MTETQVQSAQIDFCEYFTVRH